MLVRILAIVVSITLNCSVRADIVIDEFDDPDEVLLPQMNLDYARTENVGSQMAERAIGFVAFDTDPMGHFASDRNGSSSLVGVIESIVPRWSGDRTVHLQFWYDFDSIDATEAGRNNAFLLDFHSLLFGNTTSTLRTFVGDDLTSRHNSTIPLAESDQAVTVAVPFSLFTANFSMLESVHFSLTVRAPIGQNDLDFSMELDRVRIGRVPEPGMMPLVTILWGCAALHMRRCVNQRKR